MRNKEKTQNKNKGFTLVELIVSFTIMMMIAALSVAGVLTYQDYADYKRQNEYAETLFAAAQSKVTGYSVRGQMKGLNAAAVNELDLNAVITPQGVRASESKQGENAKKGKIYYLVGSRENYEAYLKGEYQDKTDAASKSYQALYQLFDEYLFDKTILNGAIAVEYNPEEGQIYSVFYSDKCSGFTYTRDSGKGIVNILNRQEDYRSENMIGYYGLD